MTLDRSIATITAAGVVVGGLVSIVYLAVVGTITADVAVPSIVGMTGLAGGFMWGQESAKQASSQTRTDILTNGGVQ